MQPKFAPSLTQQAHSDFVWPTGDWAIQADRQSRVCLGVRDVPERQTQIVEAINTVDATVLVRGQPGSGLTSVLRVLLTQAAETATGVVVLDPTGRGGDRWEELVSGSGSWIETRASPVDLLYIIDQLEQPSYPDGTFHLVVAIDRLEMLVSDWMEDQVGRFSRIIGDAPRRGVSVFASASSRLPLPVWIERAFNHRYTYMSEYDRLLMSEDRHAVRPFVLDAPSPLAIKRRHAFGRLSQLEVSDIVAAHGSDGPVVAVDEVSHEALYLTAGRDLIILGGGAVARSGVATRISELAAQALGRPIFAFGGDLKESWLMPFLTTERQASLEERVCSAFGSLDEAILLLPEIDQLEQLMAKAARKGSRSGSPALSSILRSVSSATVVITTSRDMLPLGSLYRPQPQVADILYFAPPSADVVLSGQISARLVGALRGKAYGVDQAVAIVDQHRHEVVVPRDWLRP